MSAATWRVTARPRREIIPRRPVKHRRLVVSRRDLDALKRRFATLLLAGHLPLRSALFREQAASRVFAP
jgi:hypothetical protein